MWRPINGYLLEHRNHGGVHVGVRKRQHGNGEKHQREVAGAKPERYPEEPQHEHRNPNGEMERIYPAGNSA